MKRVLVFHLLVFLSCISLAEQEKDWKKVIDKNGVQVYRAHNDDSRLKSFKSVTRMKLDNIKAFVGVLMDDDSFPQWVHMLSKAEISPTDNPVKYEIYVETSLPWPVKDRHTKAEYIIRQLDDYSIRFEMEKASIPPPEKKGSILAPETYGYYELKTVAGSDVVEITVEIFVDPGGYVPAFLINLLTDDMSYYTMLKFRRMILREEYQNYTTDLVNRRPWIEEI